MIIELLPLFSRYFIWCVNWGVGSLLIGATVVAFLISVIFFVATGVAFFDLVRGS